MFDRKTVQDVDVRDERVLVRVDYNVPMEGGRVQNDRRIRASLPTLRQLCDGGARVTLCAHLGRPGGEPDPELSLEPLASILRQLSGRAVDFASDCVGDEVQAAVERLQPGRILLLENTRFHPGEKENDDEFARRLAAPHDLFVGDAFAAAHRAHASTVGVTEHLPAVAGLLLVREVEALGGLIEEPEHPFVVVLGGAKVGDKIGVIRRLMEFADRLLVGGGMANTLLKANGCDVADSLIDEDSVGHAYDLLQDLGDRIQLPDDVLIAPSPEHEEQAQPADVDGIPAGWQILDLGPDTLDAYERILRKSAAVVWNGPVGMFERPRFSGGTLRMARVLSQIDGRAVVGGGETGQAVDQAGVSDQLFHVSTGGGAFLEFLEGKELPGIDALERRS